MGPTGRANLTSAADLDDPRLYLRQELRSHGETRVMLEIEAASDPGVELIGLRDQREVFERVFGRTLEIATVDVGALQAV